VRAKSIVLSLGAVAVVTGAIFALEPVAPVLSLGVLYLFAVLPVAALWGLPLAAFVSVVSMLTFNFLFLPPRHTFRLADSENWVALAVYLVTAISVSELAARARRRADEAERLAHAARETEELRRSDAVKTAVLRTVSHDLRSPITAIMTASDLLESSSATLSTEEHEELYSSIRLQIHRLDRFVSNLLDLSRLEAGAARPLPELWTVDGLVARALDAIGPENERIDTAFHDDSPPLRVDAAQIEHALVNVLENALKFSSPTDVVELRTEGSGGELVIRITDHGPGMPSGEREEIFEPFRRGTMTEGRTGSGLGLAIARGFVQLNGGRIWVESEPGRGTTVAVAFPAARMPAEATV
jgi:two-component system, OmpR family, sensor histidine kinase KdpD